MIEYIVKDMVSVLRFLPYGLVVGIIVAIAVSAINRRRIRKGKKPVSAAAVTGFFMYAAIILVITFWSREDGSRNVKIDLELFSSLGINDRNDALVVENILLFVPYGFVCAWLIQSARKFSVCTMLGLCTSVGIECLQLVTGRGFFQIDDILTNVVGTIIGYVLFRCFWKNEEKGGARARLFYIILTAFMMFLIGFGVIASSGESILACVLKNPLLQKVVHASEYTALAVVFGFGCQTIRRGRGKAFHFFFAVLFGAAIAVAGFFLQKYVFLEPETMTDVLIHLGGVFAGGCIYLALAWVSDMLSGEETKE